MGGTWSQGEALPKLLQPGVHLRSALFLTLPSVHLCVGGQDLRDTFQIAWVVGSPCPRPWVGSLCDPQLEEGGNDQYHHRKTAPSLYVLLKEEWSIHSDRSPLKRFLWCVWLPAHYNSPGFGSIVKGSLNSSLLMALTLRASVLIGIINVIQAREGLRRLQTAQSTVCKPSHKTELSCCTASPLSSSLHPHLTAETRCVTLNKRETKASSGREEELGNEDHMSESGKTVTFI